MFHLLHKAGTKAGMSEERKTDPTSRPHLLKNRSTRVGSQGNQDIGDWARLNPEANTYAIKNHSLGEDYGLPQPKKWAYKKVWTSTISYY